MALRLLLIDNYDSYTYNLSHLLAKANYNTPPTILLADQFPTLSSLTSVHGIFDAYILSPGPGDPQSPIDFSPLQTDLLRSHHPVLAICLGHQALCLSHGTPIHRTPAGPAHGKISTVTRAPAGHDCPLLRGLPSIFRVVRYHSLSVNHAYLPPTLLPTVWATDLDRSGNTHRVLMAVRHRTRPIFGLQFHPESVASDHGALLAANFLRVARLHQPPSPAPPLSPAGRSQSLPLPTLAKPASPHLQTLVRVLPFDTARSAALFERLFAARAPAFWLDSSCATQQAASVSRCSSPGVAAAEGEPCEPEESDARADRFSLMGACDGPLSELVTYDVGERAVVVRSADGEVRRARDTSVFEYLEERLRERYAPSHPLLPLEMNGGYVGFFGYELRQDSDAISGNRHVSQLPDAWFVFADRVLVLDHEEDLLYMVAVVREMVEEDRIGAARWFDELSNTLERWNAAACPISPSLFQARAAAFGADKRKALTFRPERSRSAYLEDIAECLHEIAKGESYEVCLTNRLRTVLPDNGGLDPLQIYLGLRLVNPAPYAAFLRLDKDLAVCCSSPERYLQISATGVVVSKPIKGTLPRGACLKEDETLRQRLQNSPKDRSENLMIVDLVRNDLSRTCVVGSVEVPKLMHVESYATVHQLVSTVSGKLTHPGQSVGCIKAAYPMGSMTGAPKIRTMEIIDRLEHSARGIYSGSIGYLGLCGSADLNVVIRTAIVMGREVEIGVGGAVVALSNPEDEYEEIILKGRAIMQSLALTTTGRSDFLVSHEQSGGKFDAHACRRVNWNAVRSSQQSTA